jgi:ribonuclease P protein component
MLPKKNRADRKAVEKIFKEGKFLNSPNLTFKFFINKNSLIPQISFVAPKGVAKLAVKRNLLRRHGYVALSKHIDQFPLGIKGVFLYKKNQSDISIIENEIKNILSKIN